MTRSKLVKPESTTTPKSQKISILGEISLFLSHWDIPVENQADSELPSIDTGVVVVQLASQDIVLNRDGLNIGIEERLVKEIEDKLISQFGLVFLNPQTFPILGDSSGEHISHYSPSDGKEIARYLLSKKEKMSGKYTVFTKRAK
jgi:hypothetical protein